METPSTTDATAANTAAVKDLSTSLASSPAPVAPPAPPPPQPITTQADGRARFLRTKAPKFEIAAIDGVEVALVVPSEGVRGEIAQIGLEIGDRGRIRPGNNKVKSAHTIIAMVHAVAVDPTTGAKRPGAQIFAPNDLNAILGEPSSPNSVIGLFSTPCAQVLTRAEQGEEEAAKNG